MKNFLSTLEGPAREAPLAGRRVLLLALVAVPVVLSKPAEQASAPAPTQTARKTAKYADIKALASVKLDESAVDESSPLDTFDPANPFKPPADVVKRSKDDGTDELTIEDGPVDLTAMLPDGGSVDLTTGGGTGNTTPTTPPGTTKPKTTEYQWVIDASFQANGKNRRIKAMERLDMLPSENEPLLLFLGVSNGGNSAVFLVDSTLTAAGEGSCKPSPDECAFVYLGAGSEHAFTNEAGDSYNLRINEIRKVKVSTAKSKSSATKRAKASVGPARHRFVPTLISDLVSVSSGDDPVLHPRQRPPIGRRQCGRRLIAICLTLTAAFSLALVPAASAAKKKQAKVPTISRVLPMRLGVGEKLTIRGTNFNVKRKRNTVIFRAPNGRTAFAKPTKASKTKLVVAVPGAVTRLLAKSSASPSRPASRCGCSPAPSASSPPSACPR